MIFAKGSFKINCLESFKIGENLWKFLFSGSNIVRVGSSKRERDLWILSNGFILSLVLVCLFPRGLLKCIGGLSSSVVGFSIRLDIEGIEYERVESLGSEDVLWFVLFFGSDLNINSVNCFDW